MQPTEARAARVGQGGARVAKCVCVRLSVNADSLQPIGQARPAGPALRRRSLAGLNTKAPARPALRVGPGIRAWEAGGACDLQVVRLECALVRSCPRAPGARALKALGDGAYRMSWK